MLNKQWMLFLIINLRCFRKEKLKLRKGKEDNITEILKLIAPGTPIRNGLENILRARTRSITTNYR